MKIIYQTETGIVNSTGEAAIEYILHNDIPEHKASTHIADDEVTLPEKIKIEIAEFR